MKQTKMAKYKNYKGVHKDFVQTMRGSRISGINIGDGVAIVTESKKKTFMEMLGFKSKSIGIKVKRGGVTFLY